MHPPPLNQVALSQEDAGHIGTLGICSYVYSGLQCLGGVFGALYVGMGIFLLNQNEQAGWFVIGVGSLISLFVIACAVLSYLAAKWLGEGKNWTFCLIIAALHCVGFPLGTALGVFTILVLNRPGVKAWFDARKPRA